MEPKKWQGLIQNAIYSKDFENVEILCRTNAVELNAFDESGEMPLQSAVRTNQEKMIQLLVNNGVLVDSVDDFGQNILHFAAGILTDPYIIKKLIELGANPKAEDNNGNTPLHVAAENPHGLHIIRSLLLYGAKINALNYDNVTPLQRAKMCNPNQDITELLIKLGAKK